MMDAAFDDSIKVLAQSWVYIQKNKDINILKIDRNNISDWKVLQ